MLGEITEDGKGDYYLWTPSHPSNEDKCLFGHVTEYHRKKPEVRCYVGTDLTVHNKLLQNCTCSIFDFECDYNYQRANDGTCKLITGLDPPDHSVVCKEEGVNSWTEPTGYRKIPITTCVGGKDFDRGSEHACDGKEDQYRKTRKGLHGFWLFVVVMIPFVAAGYIGHHVWNRTSGRSLGQIRLGDDSFENEIYHGRDKIQEYAVVMVSGIIAVLGAVPMIATVLWSTIVDRLGGRFRGHESRYYDPLSTEGLLSDDEDPLDEEI